MNAKCLSVRRRNSCLSASPIFPALGFKLRGFAQDYIQNSFCFVLHRSCGNCEGNIWKMRLITLTMLSDARPGFRVYVSGLRASAVPETLNYVVPKVHSLFVVGSGTDPMRRSPFYDATGKKAPYVPIQMYPVRSPKLKADFQTSTQTTLAFPCVLEQVQNDRENNGSTNKGIAKAFEGSARLCPNMQKLGYFSRNSIISI